MSGLAGTKRNLLGNFFHCWSTWRGLRRYPGLFSLSDALLDWQPVLLPRRFSYRAAGRALAREARAESLPDGASRVTLTGHDLVFYWTGTYSNNIHYLIDQEFNPRIPHNYTTPPVRLTSQSVILDVGACEGLFAFRVLRQHLAARVIGFEPSPRNVKYTRLAAEQNRLADKITIEQLAVGRTSGRVQFVEQAGTADGHSIARGDEEAQLVTVDCVSLDDYCAAKQIKLGRSDLIKIDAEGSDLDVLLGAEKLIRESAPQIAVTTYHKSEHAAQIVDFLKSVQPSYRMRLKGFSSWTPTPTPVLLQAAVSPEPTHG